MFNVYDLMYVFNKRDAKIIYRCINALVGNAGRRMLSCDNVIAYTLLCMLEKHYGLSLNNPITFYIDALCVTVGYSEYTDKYILSVFEDLEYAERCRASA